MLVYVKVGDTPYCTKPTGLINTGVSCLFDGVCQFLWCGPSPVPFVRDGAVCASEGRETKNEYYRGTNTPWKLSQPTHKRSAEYSRGTPAKTQKSEQSTQNIFAEGECCAGCGTSEAHTKCRICGHYFHHCCGHDPDEIGSGKCVCIRCVSS